MEYKQTPTFCIMKINIDTREKVFLIKLSSQMHEIEKLLAELSQIEGYCYSAEPEDT